MTQRSGVEGFPPAANRGPTQTLWGRLGFWVRRALDLQVATVYRDLRPWANEQSGALLEVGCGAQPYRHLIPQGCRYTGLDWEQAGANFAYFQPDTVLYSGDRFPFADASFETLFHTEVLEHIYQAQGFLSECSRVLKPSGKMFFTVPFQARYHYVPHDYFRFTPAALERMLGEAGFCAIQIKARGSDLSVAAYKTLSIIFRWARSGPAGVALALLCAPLALPALLVAWLSLWLSLGSTEDCLGYTVTAEALPTNTAPVSPGLA
jgi:SAM-dependent methyltransferase